MHDVQLLHTVLKKNLRLALIMNINRSTQQSSSIELSVNYFFINKLCLD